MPRGKTPTPATTPEKPSGGLRSTDLEATVQDTQGPVEHPKPKAGKCCIGDPECDCGGYAWASVADHQPNVCAGPHRRDWKERSVTK